MKLLLPGCLAVVVGLAAVIAQDSPLAKPVREATMHVDGVAAPADTNAVMDHADAVIVGRYTGNSYPFERAYTPGAIPRLMTRYLFQVLEVIKNDPLLPAQVGKHFEVELLGGQIEQPDHIQRVRVEGASVPQFNRTYVIVLVRDHLGRELLPAYTGYGGLFDISEERVVPMSPYGIAHSGKDAATLLAGLRARARAGRQARRLGSSDADLLRLYPGLQAEDLATAWAYVRAHRDEIDLQIRDHESV